MYCGTAKHYLIGEVQSAYGPILAQAGGIGNRNRLSAKATQTLSFAWAEAQRLYGFFGNGAPPLIQ
jgi:hypothetical protein